MRGRNRAVFVDRDGTLNVNIDYLSDPAGYQLYPGVAQGLRLLREGGFLIVVITNQSGVARGYFPESLVEEVHRKMVELLQREGAYLDCSYYCPHQPHEGDPPYRQRCHCRKPATGLVEEAVRKLDLDLRGSYVVGDRGMEMEFAQAIGVEGILVLTGYGKGEWEFLRGRWKATPAYVAEDLYDAARWIVGKNTKRGGIPE